MLPRMSRAYYRSTTALILWLKPQGQSSIVKCSGQG